MQHIGISVLSVLIVFCVHWLKEYLCNYDSCFRDYLHDLLPFIKSTDEQFEELGFTILEKYERGIWYSRQCPYFTHIIYIMCTYSGETFIYSYSDKFLNFKDHPEVPLTLKEARLAVRKAKEIGRVLKKR